MQGKQRRGRRPIVTTLVSERRIPGGREFIFTSHDPQQDQEPRSGRALQTARAFSWDDAPAANDPGLTPVQAAPTGEEDYTQFLQALRKVYRAKRRLS